VLQRLVLRAQLLDLSLQRRERVGRRDLGELHRLALRRQRRLQLLDAALELAEQLHMLAQADARA